MTVSPQKNLPQFLITHPTDLSKLLVGYSCLLREFNLSSFNYKEIVAQTFKQDKRNFGLLVCACYSNSGDQVAIVNNLKELLVYSISNMDLVLNLVLPRSGVKVCFSKDNKSILVADKAGHVINYCIEKTEITQKILVDTLSTITDMYLSVSNYLAVCDREGRIRVSFFPNAYHILSYCIGHEGAVTCLSFTSSGLRLFSGSNDGTVKLWDPTNGKELFSLEPFSTVHKHKVCDLQCSASQHVCVCYEGLSVAEVYKYSLTTEGLETLVCNMFMCVTLILNIFQLHVQSINTNSEVLQTVFDVENTLYILERCPPYITSYQFLEGFFSESSSEYLATDCYLSDLQ
ncbi:tRNA (guanine-N(7)-)-methyltransferase non-catalytic subunit wuho-like isoform X2 [Zophobas morio]|uniref:tRNA (guanine-N(7)-)-methyltransferase non-catalytic subunit wuho-like isoform X2 n=1 Tax=Zophobas morio TaxID=2755281 RepID=UPI003083EDA9